LLRRNGLLAVTIVAIAIPFVVGVVWRLAAAHDPPFPSFDPALLELGVSAVGEHSVLVGPYSRFGWNHPGPLYLYWLAVPYRLFGSTYPALAVGAVFVNLAAAVGLVLVALRRGSTALATWTGVAVIVYLAAAGPVAFDTWNPWVTILPFALALLLAWTFACGDLWAFPVLVAVATFLVQTHVAYVGPVTAVVAGALVVVAFDARRVRRDADEWLARRRALTRTALVAGLVLVVLWIPPVVDQLLHDPGNLGQLFQFVREGQSDHSLGEGIEAVWRYLGVLPASLVDGTTIGSVGRGGVPAWSSALTLVAVGAATVVAIRHRMRDQLVLVGFVALAAVMGVLAVSRIVGPSFEYLVHWMSALGLVAWIAVGSVVTASVAHGALRAPPRVWGALSAGFVVVVVVAVALLARDVMQAAQVEDRDADRPPIEAMADRLERQLPPPGRAEVAMRVPQPTFFAWPWVAGVTLELQRRGHTVRVERGLQSDVLFSEWDLAEPGSAPVVVTWDTVQPGRRADVEVKGLALDVMREAPVRDPVSP
jgi:hypothetical protein